MINNKALVFTCFDSGESTSNRWEGREGTSRVAHICFAHPGTPEGALLRVSIEVRCLVLY